MTSEDQERELKRLEVFAYKNLKRNSIISIADGAVFAIGSGMLPVSTVIVYFISNYVHSNTLIGLLTTLNVLLSNSPQILVAKKLEMLETYKEYFIKVALLMRLMWFLLAIDVFVFAAKNELLFIILFYIIFSLQGFFASFANITWFNLILKLVPERQRSKFFGIRSSIGGLCETFGAFLMGRILRLLHFPYNYGLLFLISFLIMMLSLYIASMIKEIPIKKPKKEIDNKHYFRSMFLILKEDRNFTYYLLSVLFIGALGKMPFGFQTIFAKNSLSISTQHVAVATTILLFSQTVGYMLWGLIGSKYGFKSTLLISALIFLPAIYFTYLMSSVSIYYLSVALFGVAQSARNVNESNMAAKLCKDPLKQPSYIGLRNFMMGPFFAFNSIIAGGIIDTLGKNILFLISFICMVLGFFILCFLVRED
ncbi:major facilitator superfamily MFS_1 [Caldicellulosiruptor hydrothermalis 108]|uniref:Major facilitator superfamily MFS_1 n=1 Tax=Caldicellulosiruptor hydrothermalis (strain DSM 18901 / VKM B-2411 / 108) TaxID=632292 RepID=E4QC92_CALH1|nr:MFS transporter [Caldicellulosiruptor hydrothermalis]ADQ07384.1 major facilitator superfamily MFS_1 [Caldicellulosiruptor hydrothermalis 108]